MDNEKRKALDETLSSMDVPAQRCGDLRWLLRNLAINNSDHPNLPLAIDLVKTLLKGEN
jgi:hypothetical protein